MKFRALATAILVTTFGLSAAHPGLAQADLNTQLHQAVCTQKWSRAIQIIDQMKKAARPEYTAQLTTYRARLEAIASSGANSSGEDFGCRVTSAASSTLVARPMNANTDTAFLMDYKRLAARDQDPNVRNLLITVNQQSPEISISTAKSVCDALRDGLSWNQIRQSQVSGLDLSASGSVKKTTLTSLAISNILAPIHYCPEFASNS